MNEFLCGVCLFAVDIGICVFLNLLPIVGGIISTSINFNVNGDAYHISGKKLVK